jgi:diguanylate cyclase (GGDEF)-like protein
MKRATLDEASTEGTAMAKRVEGLEDRLAGSTNGDKSGLPPPAAAAERVAADVDQTASETDQSLADADQTLSDTDQTASESDQAQADADQRSSERDQIAADRERSMRDSTDEKYRQASATSQADRARSKADRIGTTEARALTTFQRTENATQRDRQAALRDLQATARDRSAAWRDRAVEQFERATGREDSVLVKVRAAAAADRATAAADRARAARDREHAAADREQARVELERAELDHLTGFYRIGRGRAAIQREIDRSRGSDGRLVLGYCDVDGLKQRNDELGHAAGDALLRAMARAIRSRVRSYHPVVRIGGDEFVCAISGIDLEEAEGVFGDIQSNFAAADDGGSMSYGLAALRDWDSLDTLLERSELELRDAKSRPA